MSDKQNALSIALLGLAMIGGLFGDCVSDYSRKKQFEKVNKRLEIIESKLEIKKVEKEQ